MRATQLVIAASLTLAGCAPREASPPRDEGAGRAEGAATTRYGFGRTPTAGEIATVDIDAAPDGHGLPPGRGSAMAGGGLYRAKCQMCHGASGEGMAPVFPALIGREPRGEAFPFARDWHITKTIGNYWPEATTLFDYIRRAMPHPAPGSLTNDEVYALTAYLLAANQVIAPDATLDSTALVAVRMPYRDRFVADDRRGGAQVK